MMKLWNDKVGFYGKGVSGGHNGGGRGRIK